MIFIGCDCLPIKCESVYEFDDDNNIDSCDVGIGKLWWICVWDKPSTGELVTTRNNWII